MKQTDDSFLRKGETLYLISSSEALDYLEESEGIGFVTAVRRITSKGIFQALVDACTRNRLGFDITCDSELTDDQFLYGNTKYIAIVSVNEQQEDDFVEFMQAHGVEVIILGHVTKGELRMDCTSYGFIDDFVKG